jgi:hypothetical protein
LRRWIGCAGTPTTVAPGSTARRTTEPRAGADPRVVADLDRAEHGRVGAEDDAVADRGVTLVPLQARASQRDALVQQHVVADLGGLADHHTHAVVDHDPAADRGAGVYLDARQPAAQVRDEPGEQVEARPVQPVGDPVDPERLQPRVAEHDLGRRPRGGVTLEDRRDVLDEPLPQHRLDYT